MFDAFLVTWRETAEALLIVAMLRECALRSGRGNVALLIRQGLLLAAVGIITSAAAIVAFATEPAFDALLTIAAAAGVALTATGMAASARGIGRSVSAWLQRWNEGPHASAMIVALVCFLVLREGLELVHHAARHRCRCGPEHHGMGGIAGADRVRPDHQHLNLGACALRG